MLSSRQCEAEIKFRSSCHCTLFWESDWQGLHHFAGNTTITGTDAIPTFATVSQFPGLNTQGLSHVRLDFAKGGVVPPHTHPLATETLFVLEGTVYTGFVSSDNVLYASTLKKGDLTMFPRATQHFQINVGKGPAVTFNTLNSQNPGFFVTASQLFEANITTATLEKAMGITATTIKEIQASIPRWWG